jgi:hypothetical protein
MSQTAAVVQDADRGPGARVAADIYGHLGPIAPGAYSVHLLSLQSNGSPQGPDEASSC